MKQAKNVSKFVKSDSFLYSKFFPRPCFTGSQINAMDMCQTLDKPISVWQIKMFQRIISWLIRYCALISSVENIFNFNLTAGRQVAVLDWSDKRLDPLVMT